MPMTPRPTSGCAVRVGFFVLRACGGAVCGTCSACGRSACGEHLDESSVCVECAAKDATPAHDHHLWAWFARHRAVDRDGLRPFYDGSLEDTGYYEDWDLRPLQAAGMAGWHDTDAGDLFDS